MLDAAQMLNMKDVLQCYKVILSNILLYFSVTLNHDGLNKFMEHFFCQDNNLVKAYFLRTSAQ